MIAGAALERGRQAFEHQTWAVAYAQLSVADREAPLEADDLLQLALSSLLTGREGESISTLTRAHERFLARGDVARAAQCAISLGFSLHNAFEFVRATAWFSRAQRLLDEADLDCVERGWLLIPRGRQMAEQGQTASATEHFEQARAIGQRFGDRDLLALSGLGIGVCRVYAGEVQDGLAYLDEVMTAIEAREVTAKTAGILYCGVIDVCQEVFDVRRAREWTSAMTRWCSSQPDIVPFRGVCQVHRAHILQLGGHWPDALAIAQDIASEQPPGSAARAVGPAYYRLAELHRLRGEYARAEEDYRQASRFGYPPEPGLAQMRLAQGQPETAAATIARALNEAHDRVLRSRLLPAYVEIMLGVNDLEAAQTGADELVRIAAEQSVPYLRACATLVSGMLLLALGQAREALAALREAYDGWQALEAPYEAARTRELLGLACRSLGDHEHARLEFDAAAWTYRQLCAAPDLARVEALGPRPSVVRTAGGLSVREVEVLHLLAAGKTNRAIATDLVLSEKTVARHVSNILTKLGVQSRAAATAYAYEHRMV